MYSLIIYKDILRKLQPINSGWHICDKVNAIYVDLTTALIRAVGLSDDLLRCVPVSGH